MHLNGAVIALAFTKNTKYHGSTKHIDTRYHFINESTAQRQIALRHISIVNMVVDSLLSLC